MPYKLSTNHSSCPSGKHYAVVKADTGEVVPGGCHRTRGEAIKHLVALKINVEDKEKKIYIRKRR
jgi:hypothetical protein